MDSRVLESSWFRLFRITKCIIDKLIIMIFLINLEKNKNEFEFELELKLTTSEMARADAASFDGGMWAKLYSTRVSSIMYLANVWMVAST